MARRYRRRSRRPYKTVKYSNETYNFQDDANFSTQGEVVQLTSKLVKNEGMQGMRKAKNFTLQIVTNATFPIYFALVYSPSQVPLGKINFGSATSPLSIYEPNQNVIISGLIGVGQNQQTWRTRLARNLNSGDSIQIIFATPYGSSEAAKNPVQIIATLNYAISF